MAYPKVEKTVEVTTMISKLGLSAAPVHRLFLWGLEGDLSQSVVQAREKTIHTSQVNDRLLPDHRNLDSKMMTNVLPAFSMWF